MLTKHGKKQILSVLAIVLLFATRWMYAQLEIEDKYMVHPAQFLAECIFFAFVYSLVVCRVSKAVLLGIVGAGGTALAVWYQISAGGLGFIYPFAYLAALVFLVNRLSSEEKNSVVQKLSAALLWAMPFVFAAAMVLSCVKNRWQISFDDIYYIAVYAAVGVLYRVIPFVAEKHNASENKGKKHSEAQGGAFFAAGIMIFLSCMFLCNERQNLLLHCALAPWIVNLILLYESENSQMRAFGKTLKLKIQSLR